MKNEIKSEKSGPPHLYTYEPLSRNPGSAPVLAHKLFCYKKGYGQSECIAYLPDLRGYLYRVGEVKTLYRHISLLSTAPFHL